MVTVNARFFIRELGRALEVCLIFLKSVENCTPFPRFYLSPDTSSTFKNGPYVYGLWNILL